MTTQRLSLRIDSDLKEWLETEAERQDRSASYLAKQAIQALKTQSEAKAKMIKNALVEADKGVFISDEKMTEWVDSWDTDGELPPPSPDVFPDRP